MIEIPEMLTLIEIAVSERGENFRYADYLNFADGETIDVANCEYRDPLTGAPLCIPGVALNEAGLLYALQEGDIVTHQPRLVGKVSKEALDVLWAAQASQDDGEPWGVALENAREMADGYAS